MPKLTNLALYPELVTTTIKLAISQLQYAALKPVEKEAALESLEHLLKSAKICSLQIKEEHDLEKRNIRLDVLQQHVERSYFPGKVKHLQTKLLTSYSLAKAKDDDAYLLEIHQLSSARLRNPYQDILRTLKQVMASSPTYVASQKATSTLDKQYFKKICLNQFLWLPAYIVGAAVLNKASTNEEQLKTRLRETIEVNYIASLTFNCATQLLNAVVPMVSRLKSHASTPCSIPSFPSTSLSSGSHGSEADSTPSSAGERASPKTGNSAPERSLQKVQFFNFTHRVCTHLGKDKDYLTLLTKNKVSSTDDSRVSWLQKGGWLPAFLLGMREIVNCQSNNEIIGHLFINTYIICCEATKGFSCHELIKDTHLPMKGVVYPKPGTFSGQGARL
jgi:hypothetical protein